MKNQKGFTFTEFLIVLAIVSVIAAVAIPSLRRAKKMVDQEKVAGTPQDDSAAAQILRGEHPLRKMFPSAEVTSRTSTSYFLFGGSSSNTQSTNATVTFAWPLKDGTYAISSLPLVKIRMKFDETIESPTIRFAWRYDNFDQIDWLMEHAVIYAVITVREKDWPTQIQLPLNPPPS